MQYEKYLENIKNFIEKMTFAQRVGACVGAVIIAGIVIYFIDPQKKLLEMRNSQRRSDVVNILNVAYQYGSENPDALSKLVPDKPTMICRSKAVSCEGLVDISEIIAAEKKLLSSVPVDPKESDPNISGYQISRLANGRLSVGAPLAENGAVITLSK